MAESLMLQEVGTQQSLAGQTGVDAERTLGEEAVQGPCQLTLYLWALPSPFHPVPPPFIFHTSSTFQSPIGGKA